MKKPKETSVIETISFFAQERRIFGMLEVLLH